MVDESLRQRLEHLNRGPLPASRSGPERSNASAQAAKVVSSVPNVRSRPLPPASACGFSMAGLLRQGEVVQTASGEHLRVCLPLESIWTGGAALVDARQHFLRSQLASAQEAIEPTVAFDPEFAALVAALPERAVVLDLETCGLAGSALFLVGVLRQVGGAATVELLLARNYAEEAAVLETLWQIVAGSDVLVTFNGKSFDWPMVMDRSIRHRLAGRGTGDFRHIDILHHARRRWKRQLPDCRLQTLEQHVCRRRRPADIPGHAIPGVYANYVRTGFERDMEIVLYHNAFDLVTLFDLALRMAA
jgi:uncharacterized protein YprB with RNaseH-like and TPR domain